MGIFSKVAGSFVKERVSNTKTALQIIIEDFKRIVLVLRWVFVFISAGTLVYGMIRKPEILYINIALLALLIIYSLVDTILRIKENPNAKRKVRIVYAWLKIFLNALALGTSLYTLYFSTSGTVEPIGIILATLSLIMFILKVMIEITYEVLQAKWLLLKNAMAMDAKEHPHTSAKMFFPFLGDVDEVNVKESHAERIRKRQEKDSEE